MPFRSLFGAALVLALLALHPGPANADDLAALPLGDPSRALEFVTGEAGQFLDLAGAAKDGGSRIIEIEALAERLSKSDVVLIGEHHTHAAGHSAQAKLLAAIAATGRPFALGMEFFESQDDAALARFVEGATDVDAMLLEAGWYDAGAFNFEYYRPLVEAARAHRAPVLGLNVPRSIVRTMSRQGYDALSAADKELVGDLGEGDARHRFVVDTMMGGASASMPQMFEGMYRGQRTWDNAMAKSILRARDGAAKDRLVVVIVGVGHVAHGLGIPQRLRAASPALDVRVVVPVVAERPAKDAMVHPGLTATESATFSRGYGDYACILPDEGGAEAHPTFGVTLEQPEGSTGLRVASVEAGSVAQRSGVAKDDVLVAIGGEPVGSLPKARLRLAATRWNDRVEMTLRRAGAEIVVPILLVPATDGPGRWLKSTGASEILDSFDPRSARAFADSRRAASSIPQARLVRFRDEPVRLDVFDGARLIQSWSLDSSGRPSIGLLALPEADGAVRIELLRDGAGSVTSEKRYDAAGRPIAPAAPPATGASAAP